MGVLYGKRELLRRLAPYKVRPLTNDLPYRWEMGTLNHECIAGITECVNYLADLGREIFAPPAASRSPAESAARLIARAAAKSFSARACRVKPRK